MPERGERPSDPSDRDPDPPPTDEQVEPVVDERTGEELGEVSGGGEVTDLGGDGTSS